MGRANERRQPNLYRVVIDKGTFVEGQLSEAIAKLAKEKGYIRLSDFESSAIKEFSVNFARSEKRVRDLASKVLRRMKGDYPSHTIK